MLAQRRRQWTIIILTLDQHSVFYCGLFITKNKPHVDYSLPSKTLCESLSKIKSHANYSFPNKTLCELLITKNKPPATYSLPNKSPY